MQTDRQTMAPDSTDDADDEMQIEAKQLGYRGRVCQPYVMFIVDDGGSDDG